MLYITDNRLIEYETATTYTAGAATCCGKAQCAIKATTAVIQETMAPQMSQEREFFNDLLP